MSKNKTQKNIFAAAIQVCNSAAPEQFEYPQITEFPQSAAPPKLPQSYAIFGLLPNAAATVPSMIQKLSEPSTHVFTQQMKTFYVLFI